MKKTLIAAAGTSLAIALAPQASAEGFFDELTWVPQLGFQMKNLDFEQKFSGDGFSNTKGSLDADLPTVSLGLTAAYKKFALSFKYEDSVGDTSTDSDIEFTNSKTGVEREDINISASYNVWGGADIFVGYLWAETELTPTPLCPTDPSLPGDCDLLDFGANGNIAHFQYLSGGPEYKQTYKEDGWYLGASYGWTLTRTGTLSISAAYADLDATYKDNFGAGYLPGGKLNASGDADGLSAGIRWSARISDRMGYYLDLRTHQFDTDVSDRNQGVRAKGQENITSATAGVMWML